MFQTGTLYGKLECHTHQRMQIGVETRRSSLRRRGRCHANRKRPTLGPPWVWTKRAPEGGTTEILVENLTQAGAELGWERRPLDDVNLTAVSAELIERLVIRKEQLLQGDH